MITRSDQQMRSVRTFMRGGKKQVRVTELAHSLPDKVRMFSTYTLVPGSSIGYHVHKGETELVYFIDGVCRVQDDDAEYYMSAGDTMITHSGHGHSMENAGDTNAVLICVIVKD